MLMKVMKVYIASLLVSSIFFCWILLSATP